MCELFIINIQVQYLFMFKDQWVLNEIIETILELCLRNPSYLSKTRNCSYGITIWFCPSNVRQRNSSSLADDLSSYKQDSVTNVLFQSLLSSLTKEIQKNLSLETYEHWWIYHFQQNGDKWISISFQHLQLSLACCVAEVHIVWRLLYKYRPWCICLSKNWKEKIFGAEKC